ncbi:hypothetical protein RHSIM_Rhsim12G0006800 [Rhododendron simsii]|uniref:Uncharacterized protein n=1 Tax=Rhododendron simsii TaxID=118357 RepID=A0A834G4W9_RHOSS|nr:hypothetical protein RHSIM_Rhsim12G0006800 [Rhododendron simsii]
MAVDASEAATPLLDVDAVDGVVDYKHRPVTRSKSGGWRSAVFIIGVEMAERFAYYGISSNLISYLTGPLGQSTATAAENINAWSGAASLLPLLGAFIADSFLGRYRMIIIASALYIVVLVLVGFVSRICSIKDLSCLVDGRKGNGTGIQQGPYSRLLREFVALEILAVWWMEEREMGLGFSKGHIQGCFEVLVLVGFVSRICSIKDLSCLVDGRKGNGTGIQQGPYSRLLRAVLPSFSSSDCQSATSVSHCSPPHLQVVFFFFSLYLVAIAQGGHKPCVQAFGADQFDTQDPQECKAKSSFFNWWYFGMCFGTCLSLWILNYIQDNLSWGFGFGIPCMIMAFALIIFLLGTTTYRFSIKSDEQSAFARIGRVFVRATRNWRTAPSAMAIEEESRGILPHQGSDQFMFLNKALLAPDGSKEDGKVCSINEIEEAKGVLRLFPIWITCLAYAIVFAQSSTLFTKQGVTMDRSLGPGFSIPAASLQTLISLSIVIFLPIYDRIFVPIARAITQKPSGITMLQRIGFGMFLSVISMVIAALVERKRLETALEYGLIDNPKATVPMSFWWLAPQYILFGIADVFTMVGLQEFFYDQMPSELKSVGLALYLSIFGVGSFLSSFLISVVESTTGGDGQDSWIADNLNRAHLDYFYGLLAGLSAVAMVAYLYFAKSYIYNRANTI